MVVIKATRYVDNLKIVRELRKNEWTDFPGAEKPYVRREKRRASFLRNSEPLRTLSSNDIVHQPSIPSKRLEKPSRNWIRSKSCGSQRKAARARARGNLITLRAVDGTNQRLVTSAVTSDTLVKITIFILKKEKKAGHSNLRGKKQSAKSTI